MLFRQALFFGEGSPTIGWVLRNTLGADMHTFGMDSSPPDVCVVTHPLGGKETAINQLLNILSAVTTVSLVTADLPDNADLPSSYTVTEISGQGVGNSIIHDAIHFLRMQLRMARTLRQRDEPVVLFYGATSYVLPVIAAKLAGKQVVLEPRGDVPLTLKLDWRRRVPQTVANSLAGLLRLLEHINYRAADAIITYTPSMASELGLEVYSEKLFPYGARYVDLDHFDLSTPHSDRDKKIGYVGRLDVEKNVDVIAEAVPHLPDSVTVRFVGDGDDASKIQHKLSPQLESGQAELSGWVDHAKVADELNDLKLLVLASEPTEGLPTVVVEALACGTPVYAPPVSGIPDVIIPGETGFIMENQSPRAIADEITSILENEDLVEMSRTTRRFVETVYSFDNAMDRYHYILQHLGDDRVDESVEAREDASTRPVAN